MSRAIIGGAVTVLVLALTGAGYMVTTSKLESRIESDVRTRVRNAQDLLGQNAKLEGLSLLKRVEDLSRDENLLSALQADTVAVSTERAELAFAKFRATGTSSEPTDIMALMDKTGKLVVLQLQDKSTSISDDGMWNEGGVPKYPAIALALAETPNEAHMISDIWLHEGSLMKVGVAPVIDYDAGDVAGAVLVAHSLSATEAQRQASMLGAEVAFFNDGKVSATSFRREGSRGEEDTSVQEPLGKLLASNKLAEKAMAAGFVDPTEVSIDGQRYLVAAGRSVRYSSKGFPDDYPPQSDGAMVLISLDKALEPASAAKMGILVVGVGAALIALIALWFAGRRVVHQADAVELGLSEIINGNLDYIFQPVGPELDGVANGLNVMLARLLGRPEPGEEEYDEFGNVVQPDRLDFDTQLSDKDEEAVRLAQEPEPDYYKRIFSEYVAAREEVGQDTSEVHFDGFVTKLRVNENNLKARYQCSAIRFKVVVADGKVSLKPVPIV